MTAILHPNPTRKATLRVAPATVARVSHSEIAALFELPFNDLLFRAQTVHRQHHDANAVQLSTLLSIKTRPGRAREPARCERGD